MGTHAHENGAVSVLDTGRSGDQKHPRSQPAANTPAHPRRSGHQLQRSGSAPGGYSTFLAYGRRGLRRGVLDLTSCRAQPPDRYPLQPSFLPHAGLYKLPSRTRAEKQTRSKQEANKHPKKKRTKQTFSGTYLPQNKPRRFADIVGTNPRPFANLASTTTRRLLLTPHSPRAPHPPRPPLAHKHQTDRPCRFRRVAARERCPGSCPAGCSPSGTPCRSRSLGETLLRVSG